MKTPDPKGWKKSYWPEPSLAERKPHWSYNPRLGPKRRKKTESALTRALRILAAG